MNLTDYHAKYFAHELTKRCPSDSAEKLAGALVDAQVDLNPQKVQLFCRIKDLQAALKRSDIRLESFLISQTYRNDLRWPSPSVSDQQARASEYRDHHILCAKDDPDAYVRDLMFQVV